MTASTPSDSVLPMPVMEVVPALDFLATSLSLCQLSQEASKGASQMLTSPKTTSLTSAGIPSAAGTGQPAPRGVSIRDVSFECILDSAGRELFSRFGAATPRDTEVG